MAKPYWKLVRDKIPQLAADSGNQVETKILEDIPYKKALVKKLDEEIKELKQELTANRHLDKKKEVIEEMADVLEVLAAIAEDEGIDTQTLFDVAAIKREKRGGFLKRVYMKITKGK